MTQMNSVRSIFGHNRSKSPCLQVQAVTYCDHSGLSLLNWTIFHIHIYSCETIGSWSVERPPFVPRLSSGPSVTSGAFIAKWIVPPRWQPMWWDATWIQWRVLIRSELAVAVGNQPVRWAQKASQYIFVSIIISSLLFLFFPPFPRAKLLVQPTLIPNPWPLPQPITV